MWPVVIIIATFVKFKYLCVFFAKMGLKEDALQGIGLTKNEARVYLALLELKIGTAIEITRKSKVHRVNVYDLLERLREKGLISSILQSNKRVYEVADPQQLGHLLHQKEEALQQIMPQLEQEFKLKKEEQKVFHFLGPEGVMQAYFMLLKEGATLYALGGSGLNRKYLRHRHEMWNKERLQKKIGIKALYFESVRKDKESGWHDTTVQLRYLPDTYKGLGMVDVCGKLIVNLLPVENNIMAIVIENEVLAETYRKLFSFMWKHAAP